MKKSIYCVTLYNDLQHKNGDGEVEECAFFVSAYSRRNAIHLAKIKAKEVSGLSGWVLFPCDQNVQVVG